MDCFAASSNHERWSMCMTHPRSSLMRKLEDAKDDGKDKRRETCELLYKTVLVLLAVTLFSSLHGVE